MSASSFRKLLHASHWASSLPTSFYRTQAKSAYSINFPTLASNPVTDPRLAHRARAADHTVGTLKSFCFLHTSILRVTLSHCHILGRYKINFRRIKNWGPAHESHWGQAQPNSIALPASATGARYSPLATHQHTCGGLEVQACGRPGEWHQQGHAGT